MKKNSDARQNFPLNYQRSLREAASGLNAAGDGADRVTRQDFDNYNDIYERIKHAAT